MLARDWYYNQRRQLGLDSAVASIYDRHDDSDLRARAALTMLGVQKGWRLADIGCGNGVLACEAALMGAEVDAIDISPAMLALANIQARDRKVAIRTQPAGMLSFAYQPNSYDLIVSEPSHPWVPGVANLFTREFFTLGRERLRDDGVFVQWLQIYQLSPENLRSVLATFHRVFPHVAVFRVEGSAKGKDLILIGSRQPIRLDLVNGRMKDDRVAADLKRVGLSNPDDVMAWFVCDEAKLGPAIAGAVINTDDNMHVETVAPREAFRPTMEENAKWIDGLRK